MTKISQSFLIIMTLVIIVFAYLDKPVWGLSLFACASYILLNLEQVKYFKLGKDGLELERITKEAKETIEELKNLATLVYKPIVQFATRLGSFDRLYYSILELIELKKDTMYVLSRLGVDEKIITEKISMIDDIVLYDILLKLNRVINDGNLRLLINKNYFEISIKQYSNIDIDSIEKEISDAGLLDDNIKQILEEARYFKKHKEIKTPSLFGEKK